MNSPELYSQSPPSARDKILFRFYGQVRPCQRVLADYPSLCRVSVHVRRQYRLRGPSSETLGTYGTYHKHAISVATYQ